MPRRTNRFQRLIYLIQRKLAASAVVTESKLLNNVRTGTPTEVDIVIEAMIANVPMTLGIECTAEKRPATVEWVREMMGKHQDLPINKSILVSKSGFTQQAIRLADVNGIMAITLQEAQSADWESVLGNFDTLMLGAWEFTSLGGAVEVEKVDPLGEEIKIGPETKVMREGQAGEITFEEFIKQAIGAEKVFTAVLQKQQKTQVNANQDEFTFTINAVYNEPLIITNGTGAKWILKSGTYKVLAKTKKTPLSLTAQKFMNTEVAHGTAKNIFNGPADSKAEVQVAVIKSENKMSASLLIPDLDGKDAKVFEMKTFPPETATGKTEGQ